MRGMFFVFLLECIDWFILFFSKWVLVVWERDQQELGQIHLLSSHHSVIRHLVNNQNPINNKLMIHLAIFKSKQEDRLRDREKKRTFNQIRFFVPIVMCNAFSHLIIFVKFFFLLSNVVDPKTFHLMHDHLLFRFIV